MSPPPVGLTLDPEIIASLTVDDLARNERTTTACFSAVRAPMEMIDAWPRMLRLRDRPHGIATLAPMIERELLFRVFSLPSAAAMLAIAMPDSLWCCPATESSAAGRRDASPNRSRPALRPRRRRLDRQSVWSAIRPPVEHRVDLSAHTLRQCAAAKCGKAYSHEHHSSGQWDRRWRRARTGFREGR